jgi:hypothetical protein
VTVQPDLKPPSSVTALTLATPAETALTLPSESTVATDGLSDSHLTLRLVALDGATVQVSLVVPFAPIVTDHGLTSTPVTGTTLAFTVTLHVAVLPPSSVVTVITASPAFTAVTLPAPSTVAISVLSELHVTFLLSALSGTPATRTIKNSSRFDAVIERKLHLSIIGLVFLNASSSTLALKSTQLNSLLV